MIDSATSALARMIHDLREEGAITVRTRLGEGPELAAETTFHLGGSVNVKVHPDLTAHDARWQQHRRDVDARLAPLVVLRSWTETVQKIELAVRRVVAIGAAIAAPVGAATATHPLRGLLSVVVPPLIALLSHYAARPLVVRVVTWALRRALGAIGEASAPAAGAQPV